MGDTPDGIAHNEGSALNALSCYDNATAAGGLEQDHFRGQEQGIAMIEDIIDGPQTNLISQKNKAENNA